MCQPAIPNFESILSGVFEVDSGVVCASMSIFEPILQANLKPDDSGVCTGR